MPATAAEAARHARRLALWEEFTPAYGAQAVAVARLAALRGMTRFGLTLTEDGRVAARAARHETPAVTATFRLGGAGVAYTRRYAPERDHFQFAGPGDPPGPVPFTDTGHWSHFASPDAVAALGGPERYAARYAEATAAGRAKEFEAAFAEPRPDAKRAVGRAAGTPAAAPSPVPPPPGPPDTGHAARVAAGRDKPSTQRTLF